MAKNRNKDGKTGQKKIKYGKKEPVVRQSTREPEEPQIRQADIVDPFAMVQTSLLASEISTPLPPFASTSEHSPRSISARATRISTSMRTWYRMMSDCRISPPSGSKG